MLMSPLIVKESVKTKNFRSDDHWKWGGSVLPYFIVQKLSAGFNLQFLHKRKPSSQKCTSRLPCPSLKQMWPPSFQSRVFSFYLSSFKIYLPHQQKTRGLNAGHGFSKIPFASATRLSQEPGTRGFPRPPFLGQRAPHLLRWAGVPRLLVVWLYRLIWPI